jgi:hypothetical protein
MTMDRREKGGQEPDHIGKANQPTANQFGATAATAERIRIRQSASDDEIAQAADKVYADRLILGGDANER